MGQHGQTPIISAVLYTLISLIVLSIVLNTANPVLEELQEVGEIRKSQELMKNLDEIISVVATEGEGSSRDLSITISGEELEVDMDADSLSISTYTTAKMVSPRYKKKEGNYFMGAHSDMDAFNASWGDVNIRLMRNDRIYFAVKKLDSNTEMKLKDLVIKMRALDSNKDLNAQMDFYVDDTQNDDVNIYTAFGPNRSGYNIGRGEIIAYVHRQVGGTMEYNFQLHFWLETGMDFVRIYIDNASWGG